jgi:LysR family transcriptional regulator, nitrogen assimilation regulatory protein
MFCIPRIRIWYDLRMDLRLLQAFIRIAESGSFGRAAEALNQTQPTVSRQIAALEQELGNRLFVRHRHGVSLTRAGALFRDHAMQALRILDQAKAEITAQAEEPTGIVSLGLPPSLLTVLSGPVVDRFVRRYPKVLLHVYEAISQGLEELMLTQQVDLAVLISDRRLLRNVELSPLGIEPLMLAGPVTSRLDSTKAVGIEALSGLPLLFYRPPNHLRLLIETALRRRGLVFHVTVELETLPLMLELIERGAGYTVLPPSTIVGRDTRIKAAPIRGLSVTWTLGLNRDRANWPAVRALAAMIREQTNALIENGAWKAIRRRTDHSPRFQRLLLSNEKDCE